MNAWLARALDRASAARVRRRDRVRFRVLAVVHRTALAWVDDNAFRLSAALAYYTVFSLAPVLLIVVAVAGLVFGRNAAQHQLSAQFAQLIGHPGAAAIERILVNANRPQAGVIATIVSAVALLVGATAMFAELQDGLNLIWRVKPRPGKAVSKLIRDRVFSFAIVFCLGFLLLVSLVVSAALSALGTYGSRLFAHPVSAPSMYVVQTFVTFAATTGIFALIFKLLPDVRLRWRDVAAGSVVTAVLFTVGRWLIGLYLGSATVGSPFGAAGSLAVLLAWVYYSSLILYLGAEFTRALALARGLDPEPGALAVRVRETGHADPAPRPT